MKNLIIIFALLVFGMLTYITKESFVCLILFSVIDVILLILLFPANALLQSYFKKREFDLWYEPKRRRDFQKWWIPLVFIILISCTPPVKNDASICKVSVISVTKKFNNTYFHKVSCNGLQYTVTLKKPSTIGSEIYVHSSKLEN